MEKKAFLLDILYFDDRNDSMLEINFTYSEKGGLYMYPFILVHELGHALCIYKISKRHCCDTKPIIVIGDYEKCLDKKPNHHIWGFDVYYYDKFFVNNGITLSPDFTNFSSDEIAECAKAGYRMEALVVFIWITILLSSSIIFTATCNLLSAIIIPISVCAVIIQAGFVLSTLKKSNDKNIWLNPKLFDAEQIKERYQRLRLVLLHKSI